MSDLGSDAGSTSLSLMGKILEAILQLIAKIYEAHQNAPERKLTQLKVKEAKSESEKRDAIKKLDGMTGYVNHKLLQKSGEPLSTNLLTLTKEEMKQFSAICKREGVLFSAVTNSQLKKDGEKAIFAIECRQSDVEKLRAAVDRFNDEKRITMIDERMKSIMEKGEENLTPQDYADLRSLAVQKEEIQKAYGERLNAQTQESVIQNVFDDTKLKPMDISEALNRITGRSIDKDQYSIIADAHDPSKIIRCHGYEAQDPETGNPYIKTEYEVYHGDECVLKTHDGRFEGRPDNYWTQEKDKLEAAANFSGEYYKFHSEEEYKAWAEHVAEQNRGELSEMEKDPESKDFNKCRQDAYDTLEVNGAEIKDNVLYDKESGKPMDEYIKDPNLTPEQKAKAAESMVVFKQLANYDNIEGIRNHADYVNSQLILAKPGSPEYEQAQKDKTDTTEQLNAAYAKDKELVEERKSLNAVQSKQQTEQERQTEQEQQTNKGEPGGRDSQEQEHPDNRRTERVDEHDPKQMTMEEAKGEIEQNRAKDGAKGADVKDRQVKEQAQVKTPKPKDRAD